MNKLMKNYQLFTFWFFESLYPALTNMSSSSFEQLIWMIMDHTAEYHRSKNNAFRVPPYASPEWYIMLSRGKYTIKDMLKDVTSKEDSQPSSQAESKKKGRKRKNCRTKSMAVIEPSDSDSNNDDHSSKSHGQRGVKSSSKSREGLQSSETELKTISMDRLLLMGERVESGETEFNERHLAKVSGATDILQASISSDLNATVNFSAKQVLTQWSVHAKQLRFHHLLQKHRMLRAVLENVLLLNLWKS